MQELRDLLKDKDSVFTRAFRNRKDLADKLFGALTKSSYGEVSDRNEKGKHTTSQSILIPGVLEVTFLDTGIKPSLCTVKIRNIFLAFSSVLNDYIVNANLTIAVILMKMTVLFWQQWKRYYSFGTLR